MTAKKHLKRRVRERQAKTGESYTAARAHIVSSGVGAGGEASATAEPETREPIRSPISVVEMVNASEEASRLGFKCEVLASPALLLAVPLTRLVEQLRDALLRTERDPALELLRGIAFRNVRPVTQRRRMAGWWEDVRRFYTRAEAGIGGLTESGEMLALSIDGVMVIAHAGHVSGIPAHPRSRHRLFLSGVDAYQLDDAHVVPHD